MSIQDSLVFTEALDLVSRLVQSDDPDFMADAIEDIVRHKDLSHAVIFLLLVKAKGGDPFIKTGVELANTKPTVADLILPPHLERFRSK